jgi:predicted transcriptional regulator
MPFSFKTKLCRNYAEIFFPREKNVIFVTLNDAIMNTEIIAQKIVKAFFHLCLIISVFLLFRYNSILRPIAKGAYYKEYLSALFVIIMLYINYLIIIPRFFLKKKYLAFLLLSLVSVAIATFLEMALITPNIINCLPPSLGEKEIRMFILADSFSVGGRNLIFLVFIFLLKLLENERQNREKEQIALAQSKGYIAVSAKNSIEYISLSEIFYIIHEKNYSYIHTLDANIYSKYISLMKMNDYLPDKQFVRINRNVIINKNHIVYCTNENVVIYNDSSGEEKTFPLSNNYILDVDKIIKPAVGLNDNFVGLNDDFVGLNSENVGLKKVNLEEFNQIIAKDEDLLQLCKQLATNQAIDIKKISNAKGVSNRTIERKIQYLKENNIIQHEGARKNGNYAFTPFVSEEIKDWLKE